MELEPLEAREAFNDSQKEVKLKEVNNLNQEINSLVLWDIENINYFNDFSIISRFVKKENQLKVDEEMNWNSPIRHFGIMNVFDYSKTKLAEMLKDYEKMHSRVEHLFETTIDFNFSIGRKGKELLPEEFKSAVMQIKDLFNDAFVTKNKEDYLRFSFGKLTDSLIEKQYNWSNGKFYYSPLLYERYASFINELEIPIIHESAKDFEFFEEQVELSQYSNLDDKESCGECPLLGSCVNRGILHLMDIHELKECSVARDAMGIVNTMRSLPA